MGMGQAAGAMAILSVRSGLDLEELAMEDIYKLLKEHNAIIPSEVPSASDMTSSLKKEEEISQKIEA